MNFLAKHLIEQIEGKTIAVFGGGFKPPTKGHFSVIKQALEQNPDIDDFRVFVGTGERDGLTQSQSVLVWEIYKRYLPFKVTIIPSKVAPIRAIYDTAKENPQSEVLWVIGAREGNEEDFSDISKRTTSINKYPNLELRTIVSKDGISGTAARNALTQTPEKFKTFLPDELSDEEKQEVINIVNPAPVNEGPLDPLTVLSVIDPKRNLDSDQIYELFDTQGTWIIYVNEEGEYENRREVDNHEARDYIDYYNARLKRNYAKEEKLGAKLKVLGFESELQFKQLRPGSLNESTEELTEVEMSEKDFNIIGDVLRDKNKAKQIHNLLIQMFPKQKELLKYNYENDSYAEFKKFIYNIDNYKLEGPVSINHNNLKLDPGIMRDRERKYKDFITGKIDKYFRDTDTDPRKVNLSKVPPITVDENGFVTDGNHRAFLAIKQQKPLKGYKMVNAKNNHYNVDKILQIIGKGKLNESTENIDYKKHIISLTKKMIDDGKTVEPLPKVIFKKDKAESEDFFGKTAYYLPATQEIVLYVDGRHPKDIVRSFSHEMIHHIQNLEGRLGDVTTTDTTDSDQLDKIEKEAYLDGNMTFRNWSDTIVGNQMNESIVGQKIVCDNCGWNWNIDDGGDDMFTCHKCGSEDNMPITENYDDYKEFGKNIIIQSYMYFDEAYPIDPNKVNLSDSIHFISKLDDIPKNKQRIRNDIFKQLMEAYRGTALESFNKKHNFTPKFYKFTGGGDSWESPSALFTFSPYFTKYEDTTDSEGNKAQTVAGFFSSPIQYASGIEAFDPNNDLINQTAKQMGPILDPIFDPNNSDKSTDNNSELTPELDAILKVAPVTFIPFIEAPPYSDVENDELTRSYQSKKLWKDIFNDLGLQCINYSKDPEWEMDNPQLEEKKDPFGLTAYARELATLTEIGTYKIYVDMDGVVADFDQRFRNLSGMAPKEFEKKHGKNAFWDFIDEEHKLKFWVGIPPMSDAQTLIDFVSKHDYEMLTAPSIKKQSKMGKALWIRNHTNKGLFPSKPIVNYRPAKRKHEFATRTAILIDDKPSTIDSWNAKGGIGILHTSAASTIAQLKKLGL